MEYNAERFLNNLLQGPVLSQDLRKVLIGPDMHVERMITRPSRGEVRHEVIHQLHVRLRESNQLVMINLVHSDAVKVKDDFIPAVFGYQIEQHKNAGFEAGQDRQIHNYHCDATKPHELDKCYLTLNPDTDTFEVAKRIAVACHGNADRVRLHFVEGVGLVHWLLVQLDDDSDDWHYMIFQAPSHNRKVRNSPMFSRYAPEGIARYLATLLEQDRDFTHHEPHPLSTEDHIEEWVDIGPYCTNSIGPEQLFIYNGEPDDVVPTTPLVSVKIDQTMQLHRRTFNRHFMASAESIQWVLNNVTAMSGVTIGQALMRDVLVLARARIDENVRLGGPMQGISLQLIMEPEGDFPQAISATLTQCYTTLVFDLT